MSRNDQREPSNLIELQMPPSLRAALDKEAEAEGVSLRELILFKLSLVMGQRYPHRDDADAEVRRP